MADLYESLMALAIDISSLGFSDQANDPAHRLAIDALAMRASELANEVGRDYVRLDSDGELPTPAQGLAIARFFRGRLSNGPARVMAGGFGLPDGYVSVVCADGYEGGIARDGSTST